MDLLIDLEANILDPLALDQASIVGQILIHAENAVVGGNQAIIYRSCKDTAGLKTSHVVKKLLSKTDVDDLRNSLNSVQSVLGGAQIP